MFGSRGQELALSAAVCAESDMLRWCTRPGVSGETRAGEEEAFKAEVSSQRPPRNSTKQEPDVRIYKRKRAVFRRRVTSM